MDELSKGDGDESVSKRVVGSKLKIPGRECVLSEGDCRRI